MENYTIQKIKKGSDGSVTLKLSQGVKIKLPPGTEVTFADRSKWIKKKKSEYTPEEYAEHKRRKREKLAYIRKVLGEDEYRRRVKEHNEKKRRQRNELEKNDLEQVEC